MDTVILYKWGELSTLMKLKTKFIHIIFVFTAVYFTNPTFSQELTYLARSPSALFMGDAFTSLANDDYTLFYNPAALTLNKGMQIYPINLQVHATNAYSELSTYQTAFAGSTTDMVNALVGKPVYAFVGAVPTIKMGPFALSFFANRSLSFVIRNKYHPILAIKDRLDRGVALGYAHKIKFGSSKLSIGLSVKSINRETIDNNTYMLGTKFLNAIQNNPTLSGKLTALGFTKGKGTGFDIGLIYQNKFSDSTIWRTGFSAMNIMGTYYKTSVTDAAIKPLNMHLNFGTSLSQKFGIFNYDLSVDLKPINYNMDFNRKLQVGLKVGFTAFDLFLGYSSGYISYGTSVNIYGMKLLAGLYSVETGFEFRDEKANRVLIYLSILDFSFDAGDILE
jgi:hypothetical protein